MKLFLFLCLFFNALSGETILKIASYNVENLFDLEKSGYEYTEYIPNTNANWNATTYKKKLNNLSKVIVDLDADIIALQEVESLQALKDLRFTLKQKGLYYPHYVLGETKRSSIKVALLSKIPFVYSKDVAVTSSYAYRNILEVKFKVNNKDFYIFVNHWKAKSGPESKRIISAKALIKRVHELGIDKNIILLGDFNSDYQEHIKFLRKREHNDTDGKTGINHVLKSLKQTNLASKTIYEKDNFYNLWYDTQEDLRYSYIHKGKKETLDNILISQPLLDKKNISYIYGTIHSFKPEYLFMKNKIFRWEMSRAKPRKHEGIGYSDHLPISAKFKVED